jgi:hypothetical protein
MPPRFRLRRHAVTIGQDSGLGSFLLPLGCGMGQYIGFSQGDVWIRQWFFQDYGGGQLFARRLLQDILFALIQQVGIVNGNGTLGRAILHDRSRHDSASNRGSENGTSTRSQWRCCGSHNSSGSSINGLARIVKQWRCSCGYYIGIPSLSCHGHGGRRRGIHGQTRSVGRDKPMVRRCGCIHHKRSVVAFSGHKGGDPRIAFAGSNQDRVLPYVSSIHFGTATAVGLHSGTFHESTSKGTRSSGSRCCR